MLPLYVSEDLEAPLFEEIENHLSECLLCHREYQNHQDALNSLSMLRDKPDLAPVLDGFSEEIMEKISRGEGGVAAPVPRVIYAFIPRSLAAAAILLVLISAGFYMLRPQSLPFTPVNGIAKESAPADRPDAGLHSLQPGTINPFLVAGDYTGIDHSGRNPGKQPSGEEETDEPYLDPLPHKFPYVQPVNYNRDF
ncbi:MAG: hypothetical protein ABIK28_02970 [Planctomycetota bacterium]